MAFSRSRITHLGPRNRLPVLWTLARSAATANEGTTFTYTLSVDRRGKAAVPLSILLRRPAVVDGVLLTTTDADFTATFEQAIISAVAATTGATLTVPEPDVYRVLFSALWSGTFVVTRTSVDNPAEQGDKLTGIEAFGPSQGVAPAAISVTIINIPASAAPPVNVSIPTISDNTPAVGSPVTGSDGTWNPVATQFLRKWERQVIDGAVLTSFDNCNRANEVLSVNPSWIHAAGTASYLTISNNGIGFAATPGTIALRSDLGEVNHFVEALSRHTSGGGRGRLILKYVNASNYAYYRTGAANFEVGVRVAGVETVRISVARPDATGLFRVIYDSGVLTLKRNGAAIGSPYALSAPELTAISAGTRAGVGTDTTTGAPGWDDFLHGNLATGLGIPQEIPGATSALFVPTTAELGLPIRGLVWAGNRTGFAVGGYVASAWSEAVAAAGSTSIPTNVAASQMSTNAPQEGVPFSMTTGNWTDNPFSGGYLYYVRRDATTIVYGPSATPSYTPVAADAGHTLQPGTSASNAGGTSAITYGAQSASVIAAGGALLTGLAFSSDTVLDGSPLNTVVCTVSGIGGTVTTLAFAPGGNSPDLNFKITGSSPTFQIKVDTPGATFEGNYSTANHGHSRGLTHYALTLRATGTGGAAFDQVFNVRPTYQEIAPTGAPGGATQEICDTMAEIKAGLDGNTDNRLVMVPNTFKQIAKYTSNAQTIFERTNSTIVGHPEFIVRTSRAPEFWHCLNVLVKQFPFRSGNHLTSAAFSADLIDGILLRFDCDTVAFVHSSVSFSCDETVAIGAGGNNAAYTDPTLSWSKNVLLIYCSMTDGLSYAGHNKPPGDHGYGPFVGWHMKNVAIIKSLIAGASLQRYPLVKAVKGMTLWNNLITNWADQRRWGGTNFTGSENETDVDALSVSARVEGNLYAQPDGKTSNYAITASRVNPNNGFLYVPPSGPRANHLIRIQDTSHPLNPISLGNGMTLDTAQNPAVLRDTPPFEIENGYAAYGGFMETDTPAKILTLKNHILDMAGTRLCVGGDQLDGDPIPGDEALGNYEGRHRADLRQGIMVDRPSPMMLARDYGTEWDGTANNGAIGQDYTVQTVGTPGAAALKGSMISLYVSPTEQVPANITLPALSDTTPTEGVAVTCSTGTWTNATSATYAYQWQRGTTTNVGTNSASYTPVAGDIGFTLRCRVTVTNTAGSASQFSTSSSVVVAAGGGAVAPTIVTNPVLSDTTPVQGVAITCTTGAWANTPTSFAYQWQRGTTVNIGTNSSTYTPVAGDVGFQLRCRVTATNTAGSTQAFSGLSTAVAASGGGVQSFFQDGCSQPMGIFISPHAIRIGNKTWIAWEAGPSSPRKAMVRTYDHSTGVWSAATLVGTGLNNDDHGTPVLCGPDAAGHVYCFYGCHATPQKISRTTVAGVPTAWTALPSFLTAATYPKPYILGNTMFLFSRKSVGSDNHASLSKGTISGGNITWTSTEQILITSPDIPGVAGGTWHYYWNMLQSGSKVYFMGHLAEGVTNAGARHDMYIWDYDLATNTLSNVRGTYSTTTFPVSAANFTNNCRVYGPSGPGTLMKDLVFDHLGNLFAWFMNDAGQRQEIRLNVGATTWTVPVAATPNNAHRIYQLADGRLEAICLAGDAQSINKRTRTLAPPGTAVWGAATAAIWTRERPSLSADIAHDLSMQPVEGGGADGRVVFSEVARRWTESPGNDNNSRFPQNNLRGYFMSDSGLILA